MGCVRFYKLVKRPLRGPDYQLTSNLEPENLRGSLLPIAILGPTLSHFQAAALR